MKNRPVEQTRDRIADLQRELRALGSDTMQRERLRDLRKKLDAAYARLARLTSA